MKKILLILALFTIQITGQNFIVEKVSGKVHVIRGTNEQLTEISEGQVLQGSDLLITDDNSFVQLNKEGNRFILKSDAALGLNHIKQVSINDLLLALAMEEIRNVPKEPTGNNAKNTAVYGTDESKSKNESADNSTDLGFKMLNGAIQLAESGYKNSSVIAAKETFRNHPETKSLIKDRLYFVDILIDLELYEEANAELFDLKKFELNEENLAQVDLRIAAIKQNLISK